MSCCTSGGVGPGGGGGNVDKNGGFTSKQVFYKQTWRFCDHMWGAGRDIEPADPVTKDPPTKRNSLRWAMVFAIAPLTLLEPNVKHFFSLMLPPAAVTNCLEHSYIYIIYTPVVPHKAVAEVSKIGNL